MDRIKVYCCGECCGEARLAQEGERIAVKVETNDPGDGLYRAALLGTRGELPLGIMEPGGGRLHLRRRPEVRELAQLGELRCINVCCAFPYPKPSGWVLTRQPEELFRSDFFRSRLAGRSRVWWRRERGMLMTAFPLCGEEGLALETLFCLGRAERVEGELCVVYAFDGDETPVAQK